MAAVIPFIGPALSIIGALKSSSAKQSSANYNAAINRNNAKIATQNALQVRKQALADAATSDREARLQAGANIARVGGSGVAFEGSVLDVLEDNAKQQALDGLRIKHSGEIQAIGFERKAAGLQDNASLEVFKGKQAKSEGRLGVASGVLGLASAGSKANFGFGATSAPTATHTDQITF